ncbi:hypothetical protein GQ54DRAFT_300320 [Martensiomyces pterosporus]|nr:hypothetical protein GQ54DRAFT_300320 [Martensiomyces pterosporus]
MAGEVLKCGWCYAPALAIGGLSKFKHLVVVDKVRFYQLCRFPSGFCFELAVASACVANR